MSMLLLDKIYEAAVLPDMWPDLLADISAQLGARGGTAFAASQGHAHFITSPALQDFFERYVTEGWMAQNERGAPLIAEHPPCFRTDSDYRTADERRQMPVYRDFLVPLGFAAGAGTVIQGSADDMVVMTFEGFADDGSARAAMPMLDALRPHLARALNLTARVALGRSEIIVDMLALAGSAAAVLDKSGKLRSANPGFVARMGNRMIETRRRLALTNPAADRHLARAIAASGILPQSEPASIVVPNETGSRPCVIHVLPLKRGARDIFNADGFLVLAADGANQVAPKADLLRILFDLTPAEARLTRLLLEGQALQDAAAMAGIAYSTARSCLKSVFAKTGCARQAELIQLLAYASPTATA